jgi:hypothetical protein
MRQLRRENDELRRELTRLKRCLELGRAVTRPRARRPIAR